MRYMFGGCESLAKINLSNFKTQNVTDMSEMFRSCKSLVNINLSDFNTQNVTDMELMFAHCYSLKNLDLSNFNIIKEKTNIKLIFYSCIYLKEESIIIKDKNSKEKLIEELNS